MISKKITSLSELENISINYKKEGKSIVLCHGMFDLIHLGHIRYFQQAKKEGDVLIVTLTSGSTTIPINTWTHVAATFDTTNGSKLYIDGVLVGTQPTLTQNNNTSCRVNIGSAGTPTYVAAPLDGSIDEAILYSRALTAGEISILAAGTQPLL